MVAYRLVLAGFVAAASASAFPAEEELFKSLLKRQEPGTPAYNCHDNCGTAITQSRGDNPCSNEAFLFNYNNCLQCSGPDNYNIWRYYGGTLSAAGGQCGLDTTPVSGKQDDVPPANHGSGSGGASSAPPSSTPPAPTSEPPAPTSGPAPSEPAPTSGPAPASEPAPSSEPDTEPTQGTTEGPAPSGTSKSSEEPPYPTTSPGAVSSGVPSGEPTDIPPYPIHSTTKSIILSSASSGVPAPTNGTATFTSSFPPEQTDNAAAALDVSKAAGVLGAMVFGVVYGF